MASPYAPISQAAAGTTHVLSGITGIIIRVVGFFGAIGTTGTVKFQSSGGTALTGAMAALAGSPINIHAPQHSDGLFQTLSGEGLDVVSVTGAFNGGVIVQYVPG